MRVRNYREVEAKPAGRLPRVTVRWVISEREGAPNFAMRIFEMETGAATPFHTHPWEHESFILAGEGYLRGREGEIPFREGDVIFIPPGEKHQFVNDGDTIPRFIYLIPLMKGD